MYNLTILVELKKSKTFPITELFCRISHNQPATQPRRRTQKATSAISRWLLLCIGAPLQQQLKKKAEQQ
jgi:hypothetical protein